MNGTVQLIEIEWLAVIIPGVIASLYCLVEGIVDFRDYRNSGRNGDGMLVARASVRSEALRLFQQFILLAIGISATYVPAAPPHPVSAFEHFFTFGMFAFTIALSVNSVLGLLVRRKFMRKLG